jgi:hypothetical protein
LIRSAAIAIIALAFGAASPASAQDGVESEAALEEGAAPLGDPGEAAVDPGVGDPLEPPLDEDVEQAEITPIERVEEREVVSSSPRTLLGPAGALWLDLGMTAGAPRGDEIVGLSGELGLRYRVAESVVADVSWGLTWAATRVSGEVIDDGMTMPYAASHERLEPGNPTLGGAFVHRSDVGLFEVGLSVSIPTASRSERGDGVNGAAERESSELALRGGAAMRGYRGAFRWAPERVSLAVPFRVVLPVAPAFIELDGAVAVMLPVLGDTTAEVDTLVDVGAGVGVEVVGPLAIGAGLRGVGSPTGSTLPPFTLSAEPWVRLRFDPVQISARGVLLLTGRDGIGRSRGPSFGAFLAAGVEL